MRKYLLFKQTDLKKGLARAIVVIEKLQKKELLQELVNC